MSSSALDRLAEMASSAIDPAAPAAAAAAEAGLMDDTLDLCNEMLTGIDDAALTHGSVGSIGDKLTGGTSRRGSEQSNHKDTGGRRGSVKNGGSDTNNRIRRTYSDPDYLEHAVLSNRKLASGGAGGGDGDSSMPRRYTDPDLADETVLDRLDAMEKLEQGKQGRDAGAEGGNTAVGTTPGGTIWTDVDAQQPQQRRKPLDDHLSKSGGSSPATAAAADGDSHSASTSSSSGRKSNKSLTRGGTMLAKARQGLSYEDDDREKERKQKKERAVRSSVRTRSIDGGDKMLATIKADDERMVMAAEDPIEEARNGSQASIDTRSLDAVDAIDGAGPQQQPRGTVEGRYRGEGEDEGIVDIKATMGDDGKPLVHRPFEDDGKPIVHRPGKAGRPIVHRPGSEPAQAAAAAPNYDSYLASRARAALWGGGGSRGNDLRSSGAADAGQGTHEMDDLERQGGALTDMSADIRQWRQSYPQPPSQRTVNMSDGEEERRDGGRDAGRGQGQRNHRRNSPNADDDEEEGGMANFMRRYRRASMNYAGSTGTGSVGDNFSNADGVHSIGGPTAFSSSANGHAEFASGYGETGQNHDHYYEAGTSLFSELCSLLLSILLIPYHMLYMLCTGRDRHGHDGHDDDTECRERSKVYREAKEEDGTLFALLAFHHPGLAPLIDETVPMISSLEIYEDTVKTGRDDLAAALDPDRCVTLDDDDESDVSVRSAGSVGSVGSVEAMLTLLKMVGDKEEEEDDEDNRSHDGGGGGIVDTRRRLRRRGSNRSRDGGAEDSSSVSTGRSWGGGRGRKKKKKPSRRRSRSTSVTARRSFSVEPPMSSSGGMMREATRRGGRRGASNEPSQQASSPAAAPSATDSGLSLWSTATSVSEEKGGGPGGTQRRRRAISADGMRAIAALRAANRSDVIKKAAAEWQDRGKLSENERSNWKRNQMSHDLTDDILAELEGIGMEDDFGAVGGGAAAASDQQQHGDSSRGPSQGSSRNGVAGEGGAATFRKVQEGLMRSFRSLNTAETDAETDAGTTLPSVV